MLTNHELCVTTWTAGLESPGHTHLMGAGPVEIGALVPKGQANVDVVYELLDQSGLNPHKSEITINLEENLCEWYC